MQEPHRHTSFYAHSVALLYTTALGGPGGVASPPRQLLAHTRATFATHLARIFGKSHVARR
jgi:hypothetical protein